MVTVQMRFPGGKTKAVTLSYDDGVVDDLKLLEIMNRYGIKGTFNVNSGLFKKDDRHLSAEQVATVYESCGMEVATHGYTHPYLADITPAAAADQMISDRRELEKLLGHPVMGMAYPFGQVNDKVVEVMENCGILYSRTTVSTGKFEIPKDWLRMPATCHHTDKRLFELCDQFLSAEVKKHQVPLLFYLWGHSYEFPRDNNWDDIEKFCEKVSGDDIWHATNMEVYDYVNAYRSLRFSVDYNSVYNPTATTVWIQKSDNIYTLEPGRTTKIL